MIEILRANTWCSQEEYKWKMTIPQIRLASMDLTHIEYISSDKDKNPTNDNLKNAKVINGAEDLRNLNDLGIPIL